MDFSHYRSVMMKSPGGGHSNPPQYSCLENSMDRGAWWATIHRVTKSQTRLSVQIFDEFQRCVCVARAYSVVSNSVHGNFRQKYWSGLAISYSRGSSRPRDQTQSLLSHALAGGFFTTNATWGNSVTWFSVSLSISVLNPT